MKKLDKIAALVAETFGRRYAVLTGRGSSGIAVALKALLKPGDKVAVPSICCLTPANVVSSVGMVPVICDCDPVDLNISPESVRIALEAGCRAVIAVHIFGKPCRIDEISRLCDEYGALLFEDACQAAGTIIDGKPAGSFGPLSFISFGRVKLIPGVIGGGAVVTDDAGIYNDAGALAERLGDETGAIRDGARLHRDIATVIQNAARPRHSLAPSYELIREAFFHIYEFKLSAEAAERIERGIGALPVETGARRERALKYRSLLRHPLITHIPDDEGQAVFRHTLYAGSPGDRGGLAGEIVDALRAGGIHASQHYFPTHMLMPGFGLPGGYECEEPAFRAVNLWVDSSADDEYTGRTARIIEEVISTSQGKTI